MSNPENHTNKMIDDRDGALVIEPERYELFAAPQYNFDFDRRDFLKTFGLGIPLAPPGISLVK